MEFFKEWLQINSGRENIYRLLARFYRIEVDEDMMSQLASMEFPQECPADMGEGYRQLEKAIKEDNLSLDDLAVDYARIFLGAGIVDYDAAYPYESVYTSPKKLIMQEARDEVVAFYQQCGVARDNEVNEPEDHMAFELEFMAYLCREATEACRAEDEEQLEKILKWQQKFLTGHLMKWADDFCADILKFAATDFYKGAAKITRGYLHMEQEFMQEEAVGA